MVGLNLKQVPGEANFGVTLSSTFNFMLWCPTARAKAGRGTDYHTNRSSDEVFWRGIRDSFKIQTTTSDPWLWRRIVFTKREFFDTTLVDYSNYVTGADDADLVLPPTGQIPPNVAALQGIRRYSRTLEELPVPQYTEITREIFQGVRFVDYSDFGTAKTNKTRINVISDRTRRITSGNDSPVMRNYKMWIPLNKRMVYAGRESGSIETLTSEFASGGTHGSFMNDVYILDFFEQLGAAPGAIDVSGSATAYWHER